MQVLEVIRIFPDGVFHVESGGANYKARTLFQKSSPFAKGIDHDQKFENPKISAKK